MDSNPSTLDLLPLSDGSHNTDRIWKHTQFRIQKGSKDMGTTIHIDHPDVDTKIVPDGPRRGTVRVIYTCSGRSKSITRDQFLKTFISLLNGAIGEIDTVDQVEIIIYGQDELWPVITGWPTGLRAGLSDRIRDVKITVHKMVLKTRLMEVIVLDAARGSTTEGEVVTWRIPSDYMVKFYTFLRGDKRVTRLLITPSTLDHHDKAILEALRRSLLDLLERAAKDLEYLRLPLYLKESIIDIFGKDDLKLPRLTTLAISDNRAAAIDNGAESEPYVAWHPGSRLVDSGLHAMLGQLWTIDNRGWQAHMPAFRSFAIARSLTPSV